ncbi:MAG: tetratricopeptide repeat protein [Bryobacteraceae bacterium]
MQGSPPRSLRFRIDQFDLDLEECRLCRDGVRIKLQDLPFRLLVLLVERPGHIVTREEACEELWSGKTFGEFDSSLGVAVRKLRTALGDTAEAPRYIETVPRRGYRLIAAVTVQDADESRRSGISDEMEHTNIPINAIEEPLAASAAAPLGRVLYWIVPLLLLPLIAIAIYRFGEGPRHLPLAVGSQNVQPHPQLRRSIAILGFRNLPARPQEDWLSAAFSEMLGTELAAGGKLRLVSGEDVARAKRELSLTAEDSLAKPTLERLRTDPGADVIVLGAYTLLPAKGKNRIRLDVCMQNTSDGATISEDSFTGNQDELFELVSQAGMRLRESLGVNPSPGLATDLARASLPTSQLAVRLFASGRDKLWAFDFIHARDLLTQAIAADPKYSQAHSALSETWNHLGYLARARAEAKLAVQLSQRLPQEEQLAIQGQSSETTNDWRKAVETYQLLFNLFPDRLDYGLRLASAQRHINPKASLRTLANLGKLPDAMGNDPRIDLLEASAWMNQDLHKARAAAERAISKANFQGSELFVARSYGILCQLASADTSAEQAVRECENARQSYLAAGDKNNAARTLNDFAGMYYQQGNIAKAKSMWREAAEEFRQVGDIEGIAAAANNLGDVLLSEGNLNGAKKFLEQSMPDYRVLGDKDGISRVLIDLGNVAIQEGHLEAANANYQRAREIASEIDDKSAVAYALSGLGDVSTEQDHLVAALNFYQQALELQRQVGEKQGTQEAQVSLDRVLIEQGHAPEVEAEIRQVEAQFHQDQQADDELASGLVLSRALLAQFKLVEAKREVEELRTVAEKSQNRLMRLEYVLQSARVILASNHPELSRSHLEQVLKEARLGGFVGLKFEAMLASAELANKTGHVAPARMQLASLEGAARSRGFVLIARKATNMR